MKGLLISSFLFLGASGACIAQTNVNDRPVARPENAKDDDKDQIAVVDKNSAGIEQRRSPEANPSPEEQGFIKHVNAAGLVYYTRESGKMIIYYAPTIKK